MKQSHITAENLFRLFLKCFSLLSRRDKSLVLAATFVQAALVILELVGIILLGSIVAIATSAVQGVQLPETLDAIINAFGFEDSPPQRTAGLFGIFAAILLVVKSMLTYYLGLRHFAFLARREAVISTKLAEKAFSLSVPELQKFTTQQYQHAMTIGSNSVMGGVIGQTINFVTELALQISLVVTLFVISPTLTVLTTFLFLILFLVLNRYQGYKARELGKNMTAADIESITKIADAIGSYREMYVMGRRQYFIERISNARKIAAQLQVKRAMLSQLSKYIFETSLVLVGLGISAYAFLTRPAIEASSLVAIFLTAATRIAPSVLRIQQGIVQLRGAAGATEVFFAIYDHLKLSSENSFKEIESTLNEKRSGKTLISIENLTVQYPEAQYPAIRDISLQIAAFTSVAIVGPSGAGKSTLVDSLLGVVETKDGLIRKFWNSDSQFQVAYVPQFVYLTNGSILDNICIGIETSQIDLARVKACLITISLWDWVQSLPSGLHQDVGERGSRLSGGQRQRIGIARALYNKPDLLVLDEATSSLDADSEFLISSSLERLKKNTTILIIAHRLSTVMNCDNIAYMDKGRIIAQGSFATLRSQVPDFDRQADLMGINK